MPEVWWWLGNLESCTPQYCTAAWVWLLPCLFQLCLMCAAFVLPLSHFVASQPCTLTITDCYKHTFNIHHRLTAPSLAQRQKLQKRLQSQLGPSLPHADYVFLKQALEAMAQRGEPFKFLGRIGLPLLQLSRNALSQNEYCICCRQWLTES